MNNIILESISIEGNQLKYIFRVSEGLEHLFHETELFIDYAEPLFSVPISVLTIPFVAIFSPLSWLYNISIWVDEIDETYFYSLKRLKVAYQEAHYSYPFKGRFIPSKIIPNIIPASEKGLLLFGGGVDCHCSYLRNEACIDEIVNINGWLHDHDEYNEVDKADDNMTKAFGERMGITSKHVRSNFASLLELKQIDKEIKERVHVGYWYGFLHSMAFIGIAVPLAYINNYSSIFIASSNTKGQNNVCASDITTDSLHRFCLNGKTIHDGFELNRQDKIRIIVDYKRKTGYSYPLHVCSFNEQNCCECEKCFRTITSLIAENENPSDYGFFVKGSMKDHWNAVLEKRLGLWGINLEERVYWPYTRKRMRENYDSISDKSFVDWFLNFDFVKERKKALRKYYRDNFWAILKRKIRSINEG